MAKKQSQSGVPAAIRLGVVSVFDGEKNEFLPEETAQARAGGIIMANRKVTFNADWVDEDGQGVPEEAKPKADEIMWKCEGGGEVVSFPGDVYEAAAMDGSSSRPEVARLANGRAWDLAPQGIRKLRKSAGHTVILKWKGQGPGVGAASVTVSGLGLEATYTCRVD